MKGIDKPPLICYSRDMTKEKSSFSATGPARTPKKTGKKFGRRDVKATASDGKHPTANQWQASERQLNWLDYYMNPKNKDTYANAYQAAIKAGYSETYARNIMSPSVALHWVQSARNIMRTMNTEHIRAGIEQIANSKFEKASDRLQAYKLLGTDQGMFVQKQITAHVGLEEALDMLE